MTTLQRTGVHSMSLDARIVSGMTPIVIADQGTQAEKDFWEYFAATIRNRHTRAAYLRACFRFFDVCQARGWAFQDIEPLHVAAHIETLGEDLAPSSVKQHLAAIRQLFDYLVVRQHVPYNPAAPVKGPKVSQRGDGKTPELDSHQVEALFASIPNDSLVGLRDRALLSVLVFAWVRISAAVAMRVKDYTGTEFRVREKGGLWRKIPVHSEAVPVLMAYLDAGGLRAFPESPLFRGTQGGKGKKGVLLATGFSRTGALLMIKRRCLTAGLPGDICNHSFRATGITEFIKNGGALHDAQMIAGHADARTTKGYDRSRRKVTQNMMERVHIQVAP